MSRAESPEARAERIIGELRAATADAAGVVKDLERVAKLARAQIDEYLPREVERIVNTYVAQVQGDLDQWQLDMHTEISGHLVGWTAVVQNEVSRGAIFKEAVDSILAALQRLDATGRRPYGHPGPDVVISVCDRPHAD